MDLTGLVLAQDAATAGCGFFNAGYFASYWRRRSGARGRRVAAAAMALVSGAAVVEALFSQGLFWSERGLEPWLDLSTGGWALLRLPLLLATALVTVLIIRRWRS